MAFKYQNVLYILNICHRFQVWEQISSLCNKQKLLQRSLPNTLYNCTMLCSHLLYVMIIQREKLLLVDLNQLSYLNSDLISCEIGFLIISRHKECKGSKSTSSGLHYQSQNMNAKHLLRLWTIFDHHANLLNHVHHDVQRDLIPFFKSLVT